MPLFSRLPKSRFLRDASVLSLAVGVALIAPSASAQTGDPSWEGDESSDWYTGGNWSTGVTPTSGDQVQISVPNGPDQPIADGGTASTGTIYIGSLAGSELTVRNGASMTTGTTVISNADINTQPGDELESGTVTVRGDSTSWTSGSLHVGHSGTGVVNLLEGASFSTSSVVSVASIEGSTGTVNVSGEGTRWNATAGQVIGAAGQGTFNLSDQARAADYAVTIAQTSASAGVANISGSGTLWEITHGNLAIGSGGQGSVNISGGAAVEAANNVLLGSSSSGHGTLNISGHGSSLTLTGESPTATDPYLGIGMSSANSNGVHVTDGGQLQANKIIAGFNSGGVGSLLVDGDGSAVNASGYVMLGYLGSGSAVVTGGGTINVEGDTGTLFLGYSEGSTGRLAIGSAGGNPAEPGFVSASKVEFGAGQGELLFNHTGDDYEFAANITGEGTVWHEAGRTTLSGDNSYSGSTSLRGGTLTLGSDTALGDTTLEAASDAILGYADGVTNDNSVVVMGDYITLEVLSGEAANTGPITRGQMNNLQSEPEGGAVTLVKTGDGKLTLSGEESHDGDVEIEAGTLASNTDYLVGNIAVSSGATMEFNQDWTGEYAGTLSGAGRLFVTGGGEVSLTGNLAGYTGDASVANATLTLVQDMGGSLTVQEGGILAGNGAVGNLTVEAGGTVAPGNSIGTVSVNGDLVFAEGSVYEVEVDPAGSASDLIAVQGQATLAGSVAHIGFDGEYQPVSSYTILTANGGFGGTEFDAVSSDFAYLYPQLTYTDDTVELMLIRNDITFDALATSANQAAVAGAVEALGPSSAVYRTVIVLDEAAAPTTFDSLSGEIHASLRSALVENSRFVREAAMDRFSEARAVDGFGLWARGFGSWGSTDANANSARMERSSRGVIVGAEFAATPSLLAGVVLGYDDTEVDVDDRSSSAEIENWHVGAYAGSHTGSLRLRGGLAYSWHNASTNRSASPASLGDPLRADYDAGALQLFGEAGYALEAGGLAVEPFAGLAYVGLDVDGLSESGGAAALDVEEGEFDSVLSSLGAKASTQLGESGVSLNLQAAWQHTFGDLVPLATAHFAGGSGFDVAGAGLARDAALVKAGLSSVLAENISIGVSYSGQLASGASDHSARLSISVGF